MGAAGGLAAASIHAAGPVSTSRQPHAVLIRWNQPGPPPRRSPRGKGLAQAWCSKRRVSSTRNTLSCITSAARGAGSTNATAAAAAAAAGAGADGLDAAGESASGEATGNPLESRSMAEMLAFAAPALGMVLADPLMSLIDTACVGRVSALQLAALGPNTAIFSLCFQLFAFLGIGTTNLIASNSLRDPALDSGTRQLRQETAERTLCNSLLLAVASGLLITTALLLGGRRFLAAMGTAPELLHPAWQYMSIRVLAAPASLVMAVAQGACLGQQDAWTPFKVLLAVVLLSAGGDLYLIYGRGMGVVGAAAATAAAQYFGAAYSLWYLQHKGSAPGGIRLRWTGLPRAGQMNQFLAIASTLFTRTIFGMAAYFSMTSSAAQMGTIVTAAHQVAMQTFWFLAYFPEPLSLAAQTLLARDKGQPTQAAYWAWLLLRAGVALGLVLAAAVGAAFTWGAALFTSDAAVQVAVRQLAPVAMLAAAICSVMMAFDGISVGSGKFAHLPPSNVIGLAATLATLHAGRQAGLGLVAVWWALVAFYGTRLVGHLLHYWHARGGVFAAGGWQSSSGSSAVADGAAI